MLSELVPSDTIKLVDENCFPEIFSLVKEQDAARIGQLIESRKPVILDTIEAQLEELFKLRQPSSGWSQSEFQLAVRARLGEHPEAYGIWVYYSWRNALVHLLNEEEFREVRTNRNMLKITKEEQAKLAKASIGIIGMSVGSGVTMALAMECIGGELRIADLDRLDLSNLNRLRSGVTNLSLLKTTIVAREIAEVDPFIQVTIFDQGVTDENIDDFLSTNGSQLDVLVEECDNIRIKILARLKVRSLGIPVVMETSDRGMLDVERFDLDASIGILHGRFTDDECLHLVETGEWTQETMMKLMRVDELSDRMKVSLSEMGKTISRWPQLASEVTMGAGVVAQVVRMILLGNDRISGRKFLDVDEFFMD